MPRHEGPLIGTQRVEIEAIDYQAFALDDEAAYVQHVERNTGTMPSNPVPEVYNRRSTLSATVTAEGDNQFDFQLVTGPHRSRR